MAAKHELEDLLMEAFWAADGPNLGGVLAVAKVMAEVCAGVARRAHDEMPSSMHGNGPAQHGWRSACSTIDGVIRTLTPTD